MPNQPPISDEVKQYAENIRQLRNAKMPTSNQSQILSSAYNATFGLPRIGYDYFFTSKEQKTLKAERKALEAEGNLMNPSHEAIYLTAIAALDIKTPYFNKGQAVGMLGNNKEAFNSHAMAIDKNIEKLHEKWEKKQIENCKAELNKFNDAPLSGISEKTVAKLDAARLAIQAHHNKTRGGALENEVISEFTNVINNLVSEYDITQLIKVKDPTCLHTQLNLLRSSTKAKIEAYKKERIAVSSDLFDAAIMLARGEEPDADIKDNAQTLLDSLKKAELLNETSLTVKGDVNIANDDTSISGDPLPPSIALDNNDIIQTLTNLKDTEATRISSALDKYNDEENQRLSKQAELLHTKVTAAITAGRLTTGLSSNQDLSIAQNFIASSEASARQKGIGNDADFDNIEVINYVMRCYKPPSLNGDGWRIEFEPNKDSKGIDGTFKSSFTRNSSEINKTSSIRSQAAMISLTSDEITFKAKPTKSKTAELNLNVSAEIAVLQAIAVLETSGLDPDKAKFILAIGRDKEDNLTFSEPLSLKELQTYAPKNKEGAVLFDMKEHFKGKLKAQFDAAAKLRQGHDEKYTPAEMFHKTQATLVEKKNESIVPVESAMGGPLPDTVTI